MRTVPAAEFFETIARRYDRVYGLDARTTRERMAPVLGLLPAAPGRVLDLGVGTGRELGALQDAGYEVTGLDVSPAMLALCAKRARPVTLVEADLWSRLPFEDATFDAVISLHGTLAHPPLEERDRDPHAKLAREVERVLRPGGVFVAEVPSREWMRRIERVEVGDALIVRTGDDRLLHEDRAAGVAIEAVVPSDDEWRAAFAAGFAVTIEPLGDAEKRVIARKQG